MYISSQKFRDDEIVSKKRDAKDYVVSVSPEFEVDGVFMQTVMDGHHSFQAALLDGVNPVFVVQNATMNDSVLLLQKSVDLFLEATFMGDDWYDFQSGANCF